MSFYVVFMYTLDDTMGWNWSEWMIPIGVARIDDRAVLNVLSPVA